MGVNDTYKGNVWVRRFTVAISLRVCRWSGRWADEREEVRYLSVFLMRMRWVSLVPTWLLNSDDRQSLNYLSHSTPPRSSMRWNWKMESHLWHSCCRCCYYYYCCYGCGCYCCGCCTCLNVQEPLLELSRMTLKSLHRAMMRLLGIENWNLRHSSSQFAWAHLREYSRNSDQTRPLYWPKRVCDKKTELSQLNECFGTDCETSSYKHFHSRARKK